MNAPTRCSFGSMFPLGSFPGSAQQFSRTEEKLDSDSDLRCKMTLLLNWFDKYVTRRRINSVHWALAYKSMFFLQVISFRSLIDRLFSNIILFSYTCISCRMITWIQNKIPTIPHQTGIFLCIFIIFFKFQFSVWSWTKNVLLFKIQRRVLYTIRAWSYGHRLFSIFNWSAAALRIIFIYKFRPRV